MYQRPTRTTRLKSNDGGETSTRKGGAKPWGNNVDEVRRGGSGESLKNPNIKAGVAHAREEPPRLKQTATPPLKKMPPFQSSIQTASRR